MNKAILAMVLMGLSTAVMAQSVGSQDIEPMLQQMQASGQISQQQADITRRYMKTMKPSDWQNIQKKAERAIERNPAAAEKIAEEGVQAIDMNQFNFND